MQAHVLEMYKNVIAATMKDAREELVDNPADEELLSNLKALEDRWLDRLLHVQDFSEDPRVVRTSSAAQARARSSSRATRSSAAAAAAAPRAPARVGAPAHGSIPELIAPPIVQPGTGYAPPPHPVHPAHPARGYNPHAAPLPPFNPSGLYTVVRPVANGAKAEPKTEPTAMMRGGTRHVPQGDGSHASQAGPSHIPQGDATGDVSERGAGGEPPTKRVRRPDDDEAEYNCNSDLGSSSGDSDLRSAGSDPDVENYILAQHDRVRKGPGKWKVQLKEGIAHINGRDYLFNKATCDLDW